MATIQLPWVKVFEKLVERQLEIEQERKSLAAWVVAHERKGFKKWTNRGVSDEDLVRKSYYGLFQRVRVDQKWRNVESMIRMCITASSEDNDAMITINSQEYELIWGESSV